MFFIHVPAETALYVVLISFFDKWVEMKAR